MSDDSFFPARPETRPMIYAHEEDNPKYVGMLEIRSWMPLLAGALEATRYDRLRANRARCDIRDDVTSYWKVRGRVKKQCAKGRKAKNPPRGIRKNPPRRMGDRSAIRR